MKKQILLYLAALLFVSPAFGSSIESKINEKIQSTDSIAKDFRLISQKIKTDFIHFYDVYEVTTFDVLPPPAWHFAVNGDKILALDRRDLADWNEVIANEIVKLPQDTDVVQYVKFFLRMTMNQSEFIDKLLPMEISRVELKDKKKPDTQIKITRTTDKIQVLFYARDTQGDLQQWNLILKNNGEILKLQERSY